MSVMRVARHFFYCVFFFLASCSGDTYAPVTDLGRAEQIPKAGMHHVVSGDTLYSIAWRYGLDYRTLASWNNIKPPFTIQKNQWIVLRQKSSFNRASVVNPTKQMAAVKKIDNEDREPDYSVAGWKWPARGKIINGFSATNKGVNIAGREGESIYAMAGGKVVYSGNGLRGYGNLVIIKHNNLYLSAYAHCRWVLVKDGDWVKKGQKIAEMGNTGSDKTMLHFEIRRAGKPVNPLILFRKTLY
jgi:lipoprotein NlpD